MIPPPPGGPEPVVALVSDLIFASRIASTGRALGVPVRIVRSPGDVGAGASLLLIDLEAEGLDAAAAIAGLRAGGAARRIVAFGPHVRRDLLDAARAAGADEVLPRSAFTERLPRILGAAGRPQAPRLPK